MKPLPHVPLTQEDADIWLEVCEWESGVLVAAPLRSGLTQDRNDAVLMWSVEKGRARMAATKPKALGCEATVHTVMLEELRLNGIPHFPPRGRLQ